MWQIIMFFIGVFTGMFLMSMLVFFKQDEKRNKNK